MKTVPKFADLKFGEASADVEARSKIPFLEKAFFDEDGVLEEINNGARWLVLGNKGSGKSAIGEKLRISSDHDSFSKIFSLSSISYKNLRGIITGDDIERAKFFNAWKVILLVKIIESVNEDQSNNLANDKRYKNLLDFLKKNGLMGDSSISLMINKTYKLSARGGFKDVIQFGREDEYVNNEIGAQNLINVILSLISTYSCPTSHRIILDGLDDVALPSENQMSSIAGLLNAVNEINNEMVDAEKNIKIIVLCRTDIFNLISDPNSNKIKQTGSITLSWLSDRMDDRDAKLFRLLNLRTKLTTDLVDDVVDSYFPPEYRRQPIRRILLEQTRFLPRDVIQLMNYIQNLCKGNKVSEVDLREGLALYSREYFFGEILNETTGHIIDGSDRKFLQLVSSYKRTEFSYEEIQKHMLDQGENFDLKPTLKVLFNCSAIANITQNSKGTFFTFKFRNTNAEINFKEKILIHRGLWRGLNIID